jgi:YVTN family beta-propeller protein
MAVLGPALCAVAAATAVSSAHAAGSVYVTSYIGDTAWQYTIGAGGALTPKTPATVAAGNSSYELAISPDGLSVYVTNYDTTTVTLLDVGADGALAEVPRKVVSG